MARVTLKAIRFSAFVNFLCTVEAIKTAGRLKSWYDADLLVPRLFLPSCLSLILGELRLYIGMSEVRRDMDLGDFLKIPADNSDSTL